MVVRLDREMRRIRNRKSLPHKAMRTREEWISQVRELENEGVTIEDLEAIVNPKPRKKQKKSTV